MTVFPSPEIATDTPCQALPVAPVPMSLFPCCTQTPPIRLKIEEPPPPALSAPPPMIAVLPSVDRETETPCREGYTASVARSLLPIWLHTPPTLSYAQAAPLAPWAAYPPTSATLPPPKIET